VTVAIFIFVHVKNSTNHNLWISWHIYQYSTGSTISRRSSKFSSIKFNSMACWPN